MTPLSLLEAACEYASDGFLVLPLNYPNSRNECSCGASSCRSIWKHPITGNGVNDSSANLGIVQGWWERWPNATIGLATGIASGTVIVDIDDPKVFDALGLETIDTSASE